MEAILAILSFTEFQKTFSCETDLDEKVREKAQRIQKYVSIFEKLFVQRCPQIKVTEKNGKLS